MCARIAGSARQPRVSPADEPVKARSRAASTPARRQGAAFRATQPDPRGARHRAGPRAASGKRPRRRTDRQPDRDAITLCAGALTERQRRAAVHRADPERRKTRRPTLRAGIGRNTARPADENARARARARACAVAGPIAGAAGPLALRGSDRLHVPHIGRGSFAFSEAPCDATDGAIAQAGGAVAAGRANRHIAGPGAGPRPTGPTPRSRPSRRPRPGASGPVATGCAGRAIGSPAGDGGSPLPGPRAPR